MIKRRKVKLAHVLLLGMEASKLEAVTAPTISTITDTSTTTTTSTNRPKQCNATNSHEDRFKAMQCKSMQSNAK